MKSRIFILVVSALLLAGCGGTEVSSSSGSSSSASLASRPVLEDALARFNRAGRNNVTFNFIASNLQDSSSPISYVNPEIRIGYSEKGYFAEPQEDTGWPETLPDGFGVIEFKEGEIDGYEAGVYLTSGTLNDESASSSSSEAAANKWNLQIGEKTDLLDPYEGDTPQYLSDHGEEIAEKFHKGISSEIETTEDKATMELIARCMSVDGVIKNVYPEFEYSQVDIFYGRSATTFTFSFYGYVDPEHDDPSTLGNGFCVAEAVLLPNANLKIDAYDEFFEAHAPEDSSSSSEVSA